MADWADINDMSDDEIRAFLKRMAERAKDRKPGQWESLAIISVTPPDIETLVRMFGNAMVGADAPGVIANAGMQQLAREQEWMAEANLSAKTSKYPQQGYEQGVVATIHWLLFGGPLPMGSRH